MLVIPWPARCGLLLLFLPGLARAAPRVCGDQKALGSFTPDRCPLLLDDGKPPDEVAGDGVFTAGVKLDPAPYLKYKILPSGNFGADEVRMTGPCSPPPPGGPPDNPTSDLVVPSPDTGPPALFYYDMNHKSGGDSLMAHSPREAPPRWVAVGSFQDPPGFQPVQGAVDLAAQDACVFAGATRAQRDLPSGWQWKVLEKKGSYDGARKFGANGWSASPCDSDNQRVPDAAAAGSTLRFTFDACRGTLKTEVLAGSADLRRPGGGAEDLGAAGDMTEGPPGLPGIHCSCRLGAGARPASAAGAGGAALLLRLCLLRRRRARAPARAR